MEENYMDDTNAFCLLHVFEDYGFFFTQRHIKATQYCNSNLCNDGIRPVCSVNRPSALLGAEKWGRHTLWEHKLNSQAHFKAGMLRERDSRWASQTVSFQIHRHTNLHHDLPSFCRIHWSRNSRISHSHHRTKLGSWGWWETSAKVSVFIKGFVEYAELCFFFFPPCIFDIAADNSIILTRIS